MVNFSPFPVFGFEWAERTYLARQQATDKDDLAVLSDNFVRLRNIGKPLSSLPGIHLIAGLAMIIFGIVNKVRFSEENPPEVIKTFLNNLIIRGIATMIVGPLVLIVDAIQTLRERALIQEYLKS